MPQDSVLSSEVIQMLVSSVTNNGHAPLSEISAERLLNAIARAQYGIPTGVPSRDGNDTERH